MTTRTFRPYEPDDLWLLPPSPQDWLPEDHLAYFLADLVEALNLDPILATYGGVTRGTAPYHPQLLVKVLLYADAVGIPASRQIARELEEDVAFRVRAANQRPDFRTISDFRKQHLTALAARFVQVLKLCQRAGLVKLGPIALDGTKVTANAAKHKAMSYGRMVTEDARLQAEVADARDDAATSGPDQRGDELPAEPARREQRLQTSRAAKAVLEQEAQAEAALTQAARQTERPRRGRPPQPPSRCPIRRPSATSPTRSAGSCRRRTPRGVSCKGTTAKRPSMRLPRLLWPPTSLMSRMTSSTPRRCSPRYSPIRTGPPDHDEGRGLLQRGERHGQHRPGLLAPDPAGLPASQPDRADSSSRTTSSGTVGGRSDAPHPPHDARTTGLRSAQSDCRAGVRPDQAGPRLSAILAARDAAGARRMGAQLYDPQWAQTLARLASATPTSRRGAPGLGQKPEGGAERPKVVEDHQALPSYRRANAGLTGTIKPRVGQCRTGS